MRNVILLAVVFGAVGLAIGYLIFARVPITGELIAIRHLVSPPDGLFGSIVREWQAFQEVRRNILFTGIGGAVVGVILGVVVTKR